MCVRCCCMMCVGCMRLMAANAKGGGGAPHTSTLRYAAALTASKGHDLHELRSGTPGRRRNREVKDGVQHPHVPF